MASPSWLEGPGPAPLRPPLVRRSVLVLAGAIFVADLLEPRVLALGALYAIPVLISSWAGSRRYLLAVATACALLVLVAPLVDVLLLEEPWEQPALVLVNRAAVVFTLAVVTSLGLMRTRVERQLERAREAALTTLRGIADAVIATDTEGRVRFLNPAAARLLDCRAEAVQGAALAELYRVDDLHPVRPPIVELAGQAGGTAAEGFLRTRDGRRLRIEEHRTPLRGEAGDELGAVIVFRDVTERAEHEEAMRRLAYRDELTGLANRTSLFDRLSLELAHARRNREGLALLYLDLDEFKAVNDELGHHAGDALLRTVAERLRTTLRAGDTIARMGGDEFTVILPSVGGPDEARAAASKVLRALLAPVELEGRTLEPGGSIGVALFPADGDQPEALLRRADEAMYRAKQLGGRRIELGRAAPALAQPGAGN
jgi:diguanylate cyclase (GGDEF)-like protein/PAS domain S-box-containing protein